MLDKYQELEILYRNWKRKNKDCQDFCGEESTYRFDGMMELFNKKYDNLDQQQEEAWAKYQEFRDENLNSVEKNNWEEYRKWIDLEIKEFYS